MKKPASLATDKELDQLLARGRLSGAQYDEVERVLLEQVAAPRRRAIAPLLAPAVALAAAVSLWVVLGRQEPGEPAGSTLPGSTSNHFTPKGAAAPALGVVTVGCASPTPLACRLGDNLMFSVTGNQVPVYLTAYAEAAEGSSPQRIWYFPRAGAETPRIDVGAGTTVLGEGVRLGPPHAKGRYRVVTRLAPAPLTRAEVERSPTADARSHVLEIRD